MNEFGPFERYLDHVNDKGCWITWLAPNGSGYGTIWIGETPKTRRKVGLHVATYLHFIGDIPEGLVLDHAVCQTRLCFNPHHLSHRARERFTGVRRPSLRNGLTPSGRQGFRCATCDHIRKRNRKGVVSGS